MEAEKTSRLSSGVGKRIIETLRKQSLKLDYEDLNEQKPLIIEENQEILEELEQNLSESDDNYTYDYSQEQEIECEPETQKDSGEDEINYYCTPSKRQNKTYQEEIKQTPLYKSYYQEEIKPSLSKSASFREENKQPSLKNISFQEEIKSSLFQSDPKKEVKTTSSKLKSEITDIDTLLHLISQLPSGVTKQTGALIIRQTMEAMGISMNKVLSNAQTVQEDLENSIRNNINVIEEYRTKIKILEQEIQRFRKKAHELEDIISLFILSDEKK